jgi:hypothetical protein
MTDRLARPDCVPARPPERAHATPSQALQYSVGRSALQVNEVLFVVVLCPLCLLTFDNSSGILHLKHWFLRRQSIRRQ